MGESYFGDAGRFLVEVVIGFYLLVVILRFLFQLLRADFYNPLSQFVVTLTNPPLKFLRRFIPGFFGVDVASIVLALAVALVKLMLVAAIAGYPLGIGPALALAVADILETVVYVFIVVTIVRAILSWFQQGSYNPLTRLLDSLSEPLLAPIRRVLPPIGGLDFSPFVLIIVLMLALKLIVRPIADSGLMMLI
ncbi:MAG: YggT family protein [Gammaproteobacteria bacterium]|nr:YggT family protein [Gammaproteobacteria bacterium]